MVMGTMAMADMVDTMAMADTVDTVDTVDKAITHRSK
jgi:hypothetical protein